jgi:hypothetical protein
MAGLLSAHLVHGRPLTQLLNAFQTECISKQDADAPRELPICRGKILDRSNGLALHSTLSSGCIRGTEAQFLIADSNSPTLPFGVVGSCPP